MINASFADHLVSKRKYDEAAISYELAGETEKAIDSYAKAVNWRMAMGLARKIGMEEASVSDLADGLASKWSMGSGCNLVTKAGLSGGWLQPQPD